MPINEAPYRHTALPPQQQRQAINSLYGQNTDEASLPFDLTPDQLQKLRQYLDGATQQDQGRKEFDLAKPPVPQYQYREFPYTLYDHVNRRTRAAQNQIDREAMMAQGWSPEPFAPDDADAPDLPILAADIQEAQLMDVLLKMPQEQREKLLAEVRGETQPSEPEPKKRK